MFNECSTQIPHNKNNEALSIQQVFQLKVFQGIVNGGESFCFVCIVQKRQCGNAVKPDVIL